MSGVASEASRLPGVAPGPGRTEPSAPVLERVEGPSALGTTPRRFWTLLWLTSVTDFRLRYMNTALGYLWTLLRPLLFFGIVFLFIRRILGFGAAIENYAPMLMLNIILFQYFQETTMQGLRCLPSREGLVRKMRFPRLVIPLSISMTALMTLVANLAVGLVLAIVFGVEPTWTWIFLPLIVAWLTLVTTSAEVFLAASFVRWRDVAQAWNVVARVMFYGSPILYPIETVHGALRDVVLANPLTIVFLQMRHWIVDPAAPSFWEAASSPAVAMVPIVLTIALAFFAFRYFVRQAPLVGESL